MKKNVEDLALKLALAGSVDEKRSLAGDIFRMAYEAGIYPASINDFYLARGREKFGGFTVPAINIRSMTFYLASAIFRTAKTMEAGAFIFEIAKSEM
ncbi:MAG: aldolase, partial [Candidatus Omnitrophica bacterium]|nr:aldolase [Candidatus Omnitrophota bacterium]